MVSLRNLFRQKRRNFFLGISIAFGVMILVVANSFSHGLSDVMFNRIVRYVAGQVSVTFYEKNRLFCQIFRDRERLLNLLPKGENGILKIDESVGVPARGIGNGKAETVMVIGVDTKAKMSEKERKEIEESFKMVEGKFKDLEDASIENPAILSTDKAKDLNVKKNDTIRVRYKNIFGQDQAARLTVVGIMKITNIFMSGVVFVELGNLKNLMGYRPWEMGSLNLTVENPKENAVRIADRIHEALKPGPAVLLSQLSFKDKECRASVLCFLSDETSRKKLLEKAPLLYQSEKDSLGKKGTLITQSLSESLGVKVGDPLKITYENKFGGKTSKEFEITGIMNPKGCLSERTVLLNEALFYDMFYENLPKSVEKDSDHYIPGPKDSLWDALGKEWNLLPRTKTTDDFKKKLHDLTGKKWKATTVDVATMYESASDVLKLEGALNLITFAAVLILFFIILIGVVNTLRMTIRERTREIGTMRAIGMQKSQVRNVFILETLFLTLFSSAFGIGLAFLIMHTLSNLPLNMQDNPLGMFLVDGHLYFLPTLSGVVSNVTLILLIAGLTAFFPARKAANLSAAEAFRHHE